MNERKRLKQIKRHLSVLSSRKDARIIPHEPEYPKKWWPEGVIEPRTGTYFTPSGAWEFIAEKLKEPGTRIKEIILDKPKGKKAYELLVPTPQGRTIYIKIHFGGSKGDMIVGRSFHYSDEG